MKAACVWPLLIMLFISIAATAQRRRTADSVDVVIRLHTKYLQNPKVDSVMIIFDRYDLTGAGVVHRIFHPVNNQVTIPRVPEGRYYIYIFCLGVHQECFTDLTFVNKRRSNNLKYKLSRLEEFIPGTYSPVIDIDLSNLAITNAKSFK